MKNKAFTLIELLVVIAIIILLVAILVPSFEGVLAHVRTSTCQHNLKQISKALASYMSEEVTKTEEQIFAPNLSDRWPGAAYKAAPAMGIYLCPEDEEDQWPEWGATAIPGLIYKSKIAPYEEIPFEHGTFCKTRRGEDEYGPYTEYVIEENTGNYSANGYDCFGADFWEDRPWYPGGPDWSNNDGLFRFYDEKNGVRRFKLQYCTCSLDNELYYYGELIWHPLKSYVGETTDMFINCAYSSYGMNSAVKKFANAPDTILVLDYPERVAEYSDAPIDQTTIADKLDAVSQRHRGKVNVLRANGSVRAVGASEIKPTINTGPWTP